MKLYDVTEAPNPRRVRIFLAEKGVDVPLVQVNLRQGEQRSPEFLRKNPSGKVPVLELADGTCIGESVSICRYFEALHPQPPLFGATPSEIGRIDMINRQLDLELFNAVGQAWVNGPIVSKMMPQRTPNLQSKDEGERAARRFYQRLDGALADQPYMAGDTYSVADITALCIIDFAGALVNLAPDAGLENLQRWHREVSARPSSTA